MISLIIFIITSILIILSIIIKPKIWKLDSYVIIAVIGAFFMLVLTSMNINDIYNLLFNNPNVSPIKILILFITMTFISIVCDNLNIFKYLAYKSVGLSKNNQFSLFTILFVLISILTIFTSNDIIILTFTPFIIFFTKRTGINPLPYLICEFCAANTASMTLLVGNPTNILLSLSNNITFLDYLKVMWPIALITTISLYLLLILIFHKKLKEKMNINLEDKPEKLNKVLVIVSLSHLILSTILLAISNYINLEMYLITLILSLSLLLFLIIYTLITKKEKKVIYFSLKRLPYSLIPFLISMFILVEGLNLAGYTERFADLLKDTNQVYGYGISSYLMSNVINNIPASLLHSNILAYTLDTKAVYAAIIGSNIGAYLTPLGALAGIMWLSILKIYDYKMRFIDFIKYGLPISLLMIIISLTVLFII